MPTLFTPFYFMHGRGAHVPADVLVPGDVLDSQGAESLTDYVSTMVNHLEAAFSAARLNAAEAQLRPKLYYDFGVCYSVYEMVEIVWLLRAT